MIQYDIPQHLDDGETNPEWILLRLGIPTSSRFKDVMTPPKKTKANPDQEGISVTANTYLNQLLAEWCIGEQCDAFSSPWMQRGTGMEKRACAAYEWESGNTVTPIGFIMRDDGMAGSSTDGLVDDDGIAEFKCPGAKKHVAYARDPQSLVKEYRHQVQGGLLLSDRAWTDLVSYNPVMPIVVVRVFRDEDFLADMRAALDLFIEWVLEERKALVSKGFQPFSFDRCKWTHPDGRWCHSKLGLTNTPDGWRCATHAEAWSTTGLVETSDGWRCEQHREDSQ